MALFGSQKISGKFEVIFHGFNKFSEIIFISKTTLVEDDKNCEVVNVYTLHITPLFAMGFSIVKNN